MLVSTEEYAYLLKGVDERDRTIWEAARWINFVNITSSPFVKRKPTSIQAYHRFPWEKAHEVKPSSVSAAASKTLSALLREFLKKKNI